MKLYKVISENLMAKDGGSFDYSKYVPKGEKKGKWTPKIKDISLCNVGYHVTPYWNMFLDNESNIIFEVECKGLIIEKGIGVVDKFVCESIRFVKQITPDFDKKMNTGNSNTGNWNTGDSNTGDSNTGFWNTGFRNTGDSNTGDSNTGDSNTGNWNTGFRNTGFWNTGDRNTGDWNTGDSNTGFFNTITPEKILVFNGECDREIWNKYKKPNFIYFNLKEDYKKSFVESFEKTTKEDVELLVKLPNFDYKIFEEISGISKKMIMRKLK